MTDDGRFGVEFVCTGNNGRSTVCEVVARAYIDKNHPDLSQRVVVSSSGIDVLRRVDWTTRTFEYCAWFLEKGHGYHKESDGTQCFYPKEQADFVNMLLKDKNRTGGQFEADRLFHASVVLLAEETRRKLEVIEAGNRDAYLRQNGLPEPGAPKPFEAKPGVHYVLGMEPRHVAIANAAYLELLDAEQAGAGRTGGGDGMAAPHIATITDFVGEHCAVVSGAFGSADPQVYKALYKALAGLSRRAIDRIVREIPTGVDNGRGYV